jgi:hypothetical protein
MGGLKGLQIVQGEGQFYIGIFLILKDVRCDPFKGRMGTRCEYGVFRVVIVGMLHRW